MTFPDESGVATQEKGCMQLMSPLQGKGGARIFMGRILGLGPWTAHLDWLICYCLGGDGRKLSWSFTHSQNVNSKGAGTRLNTASWCLFNISCMTSFLRLVNGCVTHNTNMEKTRCHWQSQSSAALRKESKSEPAKCSSLWRHKTRGS